MIQVFSLICLLIFSFNSSIAQSKLRADSQAILKAKCMDCHSDQTSYPWYSKLPIIQDLIKADIEKGKSYLHLEEQIFSKRKEKDISKHIVLRLEEVVKRDSMPPIQYKAMHWDKILTKEDRRVLLDWINNLKGLVLEPLPSKELLNLDNGKVLLGEKLFHEPRLSADNTISCASCHDLSKGGTDQNQYSRGINGIKGHINSPTVYNSSYNIKQFWDGRADDLQAQASGPVHNPAEMGSSWDEVLTKIRKDEELVELFKKSFGTKDASEISGDMIAVAIAEFEKSLITPNSRFDKYLRGDNSAINAQEKQGFTLFKKYNCTTCHNGPAIGGASFEKMGKYRDYFADRDSGLNGLKKMEISKEDYGRFAVTRDDLDRYKFKVPTLRNVSLTYPYFHDGNVKTLKEAVRIMAIYQSGLELNDRELDLLVQFLKTLTDEDLAAMK